MLTDMVTSFGFGTAQPESLSPRWVVRNRRSALEGHDKATHTACPSVLAEASLAL
jgi:hypothetical protein